MRSCTRGPNYICGYAVECALKACIAKLFCLTSDYEFPEQGKRGAGKGGGGGFNFFSHNVEFLLKGAGLTLLWTAELASDVDLKQNWNIVKDWTEESRYQLSRTQQEANDYYTAVSDAAHGVLPCLKKFW